MNYIKNINLTKHKFIIFSEDSSLKLDYVEKSDKYIIDISSMNLINATKIAILCSTYCYINDFKKKLCWKVADSQIKNAISILCLGNIEPSIVKNSNIEDMGLAS